MESAQPVFPSPASTALAEVQAAIAGLAQPASEAEAIEQLQQYEAIKATAAAHQARAAALLEQYRLNAEAERGIPKTRWGKGLAAEIGLARGDSPARGAKHLQLANALTQDLPQTYRALHAGTIHEEHAQVVTKETAWLSTAHRRAVDARLVERQIKLHRYGHVICTVLDNPEPGVFPGESGVPGLSSKQDGLPSGELKVAKHIQ